MTPPKPRSGTLSLAFPGDDNGLIHVLQGRFDEQILHHANETLLSYTPPYALMTEMTAC